MQLKKNGSGKKQFTYKNSGVDIDAGNEAVNLIKKPVMSTFNGNVLNDLGSFAALFSFDSTKYINPVLVSSTDGVGTKLLLARQTGLYENIGQDLVAMCINDLVCCGAEPLFFLDYIACGKVYPEKIEIIVSSIAKSCLLCGAALVGGETAEMPDMYARDDIDLAGFAVGVVEKEKIINPSLVTEGDLVFGAASSGFHSNGYSLVRKIINDKKINLDSGAIGRKLMEPTILYSRFVLGAAENGIEFKGIAHITGGGFYENINRVLPPDLDAAIEYGSWKVPDIFNFFRNAGNLELNEMFRVFNMGIGMVFIIAPGSGGRFIEFSKNSGVQIFQIGSVVKGSKKVLINNFNGK
jgi:phosphoribosylformylglycinamidine cyclo-ligase